MIPPRQAHQNRLLITRYIQFFHQRVREMFGRAQLVGFDFANRDFGAADLVRQFSLRQVVRAPMRSEPFAERGCRVCEHEISNPYE